VQRGRMQVFRPRRQRPRAHPAGIPRDAGCFAPTRRPCVGSGHTTAGSGRTRSSPSRWRFRPLSPLTVRFRVKPPGWAST
jgi:hypothetical protein